MAADLSLAVQTYLGNRIPLYSEAMRSHIAGRSALLKPRDMRAQGMGSTEGNGEPVRYPFPVIMRIDCFSRRRRRGPEDDDTRATPSPSIRRPLFAILARRRRQGQLDTCRPIRLGQSSMIAKTTASTSRSEPHWSLSAKGQAASARPCMQVPNRWPREAMPICLRHQLSC